MRLHSIAATNYRTLQDLTLEFAKNYCTVSGRNNAGKSSVIRLLSALFRTGTQYRWMTDDQRFDYNEDKTQWVKEAAPLKIVYKLHLTKEEDPALISFIEKIASKQIDTPSILISVTYKLSEGDLFAVMLEIGDERTDEKAAKEVDKRIKDSNLLFLYNSTTPHEEYYFAPRGRPRMLYDFIMSRDERKALDDAGKLVERKLRRLAKAHTQGLSDILGELTERYDVELSPPESYAARRTPIGINLKDRAVEVPLGDWGSGTQNRTHILMAILQANRIRTTNSPAEKITPFVVIEEPESFLHPAAQAEFGRLLRRLSNKFGIQIIVTTHSPYMLNQEEASSNILLSREIRRGKAHNTVVVNTSGDNWMAPFSDHLGLAPEEFLCWRPVFSSYKSKVLLVEGSTDQQYFQFFQGDTPVCDRLSGDVEVQAYGGKDALKNTLLLQFVLRKFDKVFVSYDLDAEADVRAALSRVGLRENEGCLGLGLKQPGKDCIEGLLPQRVLAAVNGRETDLVMKLGSKDNSERRNAKDALKQKYLQEFKAHSDYTKEELADLHRVLKTINSRLA